MKNKNLPALFLLFIFSAFQHLTAQTLKWAVGSNCPKGVVESWQTAVDKAGNIYEAGVAFPYLSLLPDSLKFYFGGDTLRGSGSFIVSADSNGHSRWVLPILRSAIDDICIGPYGELFVFGTFNTTLSIGTHTITSSASLNSGYIAKFDTSGNVIWLKALADSCVPHGTVDAAGNVIAAGSFTGAHITIGTTTLTNFGPKNTKDVFVTKLDSAGNLLWAKRFGGDTDENVRSVSCAPNGDIFITGGFLSPTFTVGTSTVTNSSGGTVYFPFLAKYDTYGSPSWGIGASVTGIEGSPNWTIADAWGDVYITGTYLGQMMIGTDTLPTHFSTPGMFLAKYRNNGSFSWAKTMGTTQYIQGYSAATDICGNVWLSGTDANTTTTDGMFLFRYDSSGTFIDSIIYDHGGDDENVLLADNKGNLYLGGDYYHTDFIIGSDTLLISDSTSETLFIARYQYPMCSLTTLQTKDIQGEVPGEIKLYPNPAYDECTISYSGTGSKLARAALYDLAGRLAGTYTLSGNNTSISVKGLDAGVYICRIHTDDGAITTLKLVVTK